MLNKYGFCQYENEKFEELYNVHKNATLNLTAIKEKSDFSLKHIYDSVYLFKENNIKFDSLVDIGSGGGFPGLVLAICYPESQITLVDSIKKKCDFLEKTAAELKLKNVNVINSRAEEITNKKFDIITARGVAEVKLVLKFTAGLGDRNSLWIMYKGEKLEGELSKAKSIIKKKKFEVLNVRKEEPFKRTYCIIGTGNAFTKYGLSGESS